VGQQGEALTAMVHSSLEEARRRDDIYRSSWHYRWGKRLGVAKYQRAAFKQRARRIITGRGARMMWQRAHRGWCDEDIWGLDCYIARVLEGSLHHLAETTHGWPGEESAWPEFEQWQEYVHDLARRMGDWDKDSCSGDAFKTTRQAMFEWAEHYGHWWD